MSAMGDMKFTTAGDMVNQKAYELSVYDTYAELYFFGELHSKHNLIDEARDICDKLNQEFEEKTAILWKAFCAYNNAPRGWTTDARLERALFTIQEDGWSLVKQ